MKVQLEFQNFEERNSWQKYQENLTNEEANLKRTITLAEFQNRDNDNFDSIKRHLKDNFGQFMNHLELEDTIRIFQWKQEDEYVYNIKLISLDKQMQVRKTGIYELKEFEIVTTLDDCQIENPKNKVGSIVKLNLMGVMFLK